MNCPSRRDPKQEIQVPPNRPHHFRTIPSSSLSQLTLSSSAQSKMPIN